VCTSLVRVVVTGCRQAFDVLDRHQGYSAEAPRRTVPSQMRQCCSGTDTPSLAQAPRGATHPGDGFIRGSTMTTQMHSGNIASSEVDG
jgi:hypothetical protein